MLCDNCGVESLALKTCRFRTGEIGFVLCDPCWEPLRDTVWIVPGETVVTVRCDRCGSYGNPQDYEGLRPAGRKDCFGGLCRECVSLPL